MAVKAVLTEEEHTAITEHLSTDAAKALGVEFAKNAEGKYLLVVEGRDGFALENVTGLKNSVESAREERDTAQTKLKRFGDMDPDTASDIVSKAKQFDELDPKLEAGKAKAKFDEWKGEFVESVKVQHAEAMAVVSADRDAMRTQLEQELIESQATQILARDDVKGNPVLLLPAIRNMTDTELKDGVMTVRVLNPLKPGQARIGKSGDPMELEELIVAELKGNEAYSGAFGASGGSGSGEGDKGAGATGATAKRSDMADKDKVLFIRKHGREAYRALPE